MNDVTLRIGGRDYKMACAPGEEEHIAELGRLIDAKLAANPGLARQSETRSLLFAALLLADELSALKRQQAQTAAPSKDAPQLAETLESVAERLESLAARLEDGGSST